MHHNCTPRRDRRSLPGPLHYVRDRRWLDRVDPELLEPPHPARGRRVRPRLEASGATA